MPSHSVGGMHCNNYFMYAHLIMLCLVFTMASFAFDSDRFFSFSVGCFVARLNINGEKTRAAPGMG